MPTRIVELKTSCSCCFKVQVCRHFEIYVFGSEGVWLCRSCLSEVEKFIRELAYQSMRTKRNNALLETERLLAEVED